MARQCKRTSSITATTLLAAKKIDYPRFAAAATFKNSPKSRRAAEEELPSGGGELEEPF
jgi:hypothetical protein